ncbi:hypothetical protein [Anabaena sp. CCY 0017]|uniref:hypothetical protein n=1 Tax=Anabaena sp. CCY 0017 TaxID=3103866 RepID=UPI0039C5F392
MVRTLLIAQSLDVGAGLLKLLLVIEHICHSLRGVAIPAPNWFLLRIQHFAIAASLIYGIDDAAMM